MTARLALDVEEFIISLDIYPFDYLFFLILVLHLLYFTVVGGYRDYFSFTFHFYRWLLIGGDRLNKLDYTSNKVLLENMK
jgi:hypothetical protein